MSKQASKTLVGAFMVGGLALLALAIAIFGSGKYLQDHARMVVVFNSSIMGLSVGSPVVFKGVPVGRVADILLRGNEETLVFTTPVIIELDLEKTARFTSDPKIDDEGGLRLLERMVSHGFRARLASQSFLTGQLLVELDFYPAEDVDYSKAEELQFFDEMPEIPSMPSRLDSTLQRLRNIPLDSIASNILEVTASLNTLLKEASEQRITTSVNELLQEAKLVSSNVNRVLNEVQPVIGSYRHLAETTDKRIGGTLDAASGMLEDLGRLSRELEKTVSGIRMLTGTNSASVVEFNRTLKEVAEAARAIRSLSNMLDRNPEVLLRGKGGARQ